MQELTITTIDDVDISAKLWKRDSNNNLLLLHMMPETKESYDELAEAAYNQGFNVLSIDFRGHGGSGGGDYTGFSDEDHQRYFIDGRAALNYLEDTFLGSRTAVVGASIGANIALQLMSHDPLIEKAVCLSAGSDYRGIKPLDFVSDLDSRRSVFLIASKEDKVGDCVKFIEDFASQSNVKIKKQIFDGSDHGTNLLKTQSKLQEEIINFLL